MRTSTPAVRISLPITPSFQHALTLQTAQTETQVPGIESSGADDFLSREKALLGDDANQFTTGNDNAAFMEDGDDDLLGGSGGGDAQAEEITEFESSFPAIDTSNEVRFHHCVI